MSNKNKHPIQDAEEKVEEAVEHSSESLAHHMYEIFRRRRRTAFERFPLMFSILGFLGVVIAWQGVVGIIRMFPSLAGNPYLLLAIGSFLLIFTGALYRQLDK